MARIKSSTDSFKHSFELTRVNYRYLVAEVLGHQSFGTALNSELEFVRSFKLPAQVVRRLDYEASRRHATLREFVQESAYEMALRLPVPRTLVVERKRLRGIKRSASVFTRENHLHLTKLVVERDSGFSEVLNAELEFARTFGLTASLQARLRHHAGGLGVTAKDMVGEVLVTKGMDVRDPPSSWRQRG
jgi:hypothetical protein